MTGTWGKKTPEQEARRLLQIHSRRDATYRVHDLLSDATKEKDHIYWTKVLAELERATA